MPIKSRIALLCALFPLFWGWGALAWGNTDGIGKMSSSHTPPRPLTLSAELPVCVGLIWDVRYGELAIGSCGLTYSTSVPLRINGRSVDLEKLSQDKRLGELSGKLAWARYDEQARVCCLECLDVAKFRNGGVLGAVQVNETVLRGGAYLKMRVRAPRGQRVCFDILGVQSDIQARENDGIYEASCRLPYVNLSRTHILAKMSYHSQELTSLSAPISIISSPPQICGPSSGEVRYSEIFDIVPGLNTGNEVNSSATSDGDCSCLNLGMRRSDFPFFATYASGGVPIQPRNVKLWVDGRQVEFGVSKTSSALTYIPTGGWAVGEHRITLVVCDMSGASAFQRWRFTVEV